MRKYDGLPELLDQFMQVQGYDERWVTVQELRDRFGLSRYQCNTVSGFLRRLHAGTFGQCPYVVVRIESVAGHQPAAPPKSRYLVKLREPNLHTDYGQDIRWKRSEILIKEKEEMRDVQI